MKVSTPTIEFTEAERQAIEKRLAQGQAVIARAAELSREESERLCGEFLNGGRNVKRALAANKPPLRTVPVINPRARERRSATRRTSSSSPTSSADPGDPVGPGWRWTSEAAWLKFVKSIESRDFEHEIALERFRGGWSR